MASNADAVAILCELADTCVDRFAKRALEGHYGAAVPFLIQIAALAPGDPQASVTCQQCDQDHAQIVENSIPPPRVISIVVPKPGASRSKMPKSLPWASIPRG